MNGNTRRPPNITRIPPNEKQLYAQHEDLIKYIYDSWSKISQEVNRNTGNRSSAVYYQEQENQSLKDFEPFDLEAYWARQVVHNFQQQQQQQHSQQFLFSDLCDYHDGGVVLQFSFFKQAFSYFYTVFDFMGLFSVFSLLFQTPSDF